jgi:hypothetical protein
MVNNEGHFTWRTQYFLHSISPIPWIFLKLHTYNSLCLLYNCKFGCDQTITKGTLLEEHSTFSTVSPSIPWIFLKLHTYHSLHLRYNCCKFGCDRSITKGTLVKEQSTFSSVSLLFHGSCWNSAPITHCPCAAICISLVALSQYQRALY